MGNEQRLILISQRLLPAASAARRGGLFRAACGGDGPRGAAPEERRQHGEQTGAGHARHPSHASPEVSARSAEDGKGGSRFRENA